TPRSRTWRRSVRWTERSTTPEPPPSPPLHPSIPQDPNHRANHPSAGLMLPRRRTPTDPS
ncbi:MAG TPA: hypothetical protein VMH90_06045, partial [Thermoplasmata archaeon]|nr:hypothetical protein [Thermoplasmata archaeon]